MWTSSLCFETDWIQNGTEMSGMMDINHVFCFLYSDAFHIWGLVDPGGLAFQDETITRDSKQLAFKYAFQVQTNQPRAHSPTISFTGNLTLWNLIPLPYSPQVRYQTRREASMPHSLLKLLTLGNLEPVILTTCSFHGNHNKASCPPPPSLPSLDWPWYFPMWPPMAWHTLLSWELWATNYLFAGNHILIS